MTAPRPAAKRRARTAGPGPRWIVASKLIREDAGAFWYRCEMSDGRVLKMSVPKKEAE